MCEGCESKKCKIAGCARVRTRENVYFTAVSNSYLLPEQIVYWQQKKIC
ncbi:hypothetical protein HMPREF9999_00957 [Alloprevotella sp. oral taxon 473 str. F0040]|nr:hypothetical protein HMPREF9999_00957 [Alloprevotella sp. oral taxon 473 str. F0040]